MRAALGSNMNKYHRLNLYTSIKYYEMILKEITFHCLLHSLKLCYLTRILLKYTRTHTHVHTHAPLLMAEADIFLIQTMPSQ